MGNMIINDNLFLRQYEVEIEDDLAIIEYALQDRKIFLTKLIIPSSNKDEDFEEKFIREVFEIIKEKNIRIMPTSPQVRKFIKKNKEFKEMLPIGVRQFLALYSFQLLIHHYQYLPDQMKQSDLLNFFSKQS